MLLNYLKIAWRNLRQSKVFSSINVIGLAISIACSFLILIYTRNELSFDKFHQNAKNIYRVTEIQNQAGNFYDAAVTPGPLAIELKKDFPEVLNTVRFGKWSGSFKYGLNNFEEKNILYTDNSIFKVFDFSLVKGNPATALLQPNNLVITEKMADKYFGKNWKEREDILGQVFTFNSEQMLTISGITKNIPSTSSINFDFLIPFQFIASQDKWSTTWSSNNFHTYLQLKDKADVTAFSSKIRNRLKVYNSKSDALLMLQPLLKQYLYSNFAFNTDWGIRNDIRYIRLFIGVAILLLIIACINFINLSTARYLKRAVEVGVRKSVGASRWQLIAQFMVETFFITLVAGVLAIPIIKLMLPWFNVLSASNTGLLLLNKPVILFMTGLLIAIGFAAGIYPAFFLSSFKPARVLKGTINGGSGKIFRQSLVVSQFTIAVVLSISSILMYRQLQFMQNKDLGFNKEQLITVWLPGDLMEKRQLLKRDLEQQSSIAGVAAATISLVSVDNAGSIEWEGMSPKDEFLITQSNVDTGFFNVTGMQLVAGKNFAEQVTNDTATFVVNEAAATRMGYGKNALGKKIKFWGAEGPIVGVVKDFNYKPLTAAIEPFIFRYQPKDRYFNLFVKTKVGKTSEAIKQIESLSKKYETRYPVQFNFVEEELNKTYAAQQRTANIILSLCLLIVFISCLGLFGLSSYTTERRIKEIGIRKVLGASVPSLIALLSKDFLKLVIISCFIAFPIAWSVMNYWLQSYTYRVPVSGWVFIVAGMATLGISFSTVCFQTIKAAVSNPARSLRSE
ncbi:MAG: ABC transporter permease [Aquabacterium sp.]|nr:ABC transporter permease [Ferruginibacter sp.]